MDVLTSFRVLVPEFAAKTDDQVNTMIEIAKPHVSELRFGSFYAQALAYYTAHLFAIHGLIAANGSTDATLTAGDVVSEKEGDLQRSYAQHNDKKPEMLEKTYYGKEFKTLAKKCIVPIMTRMGDE